MGQTFWEAVVSALGSIGIKVGVLFAAAVGGFCSLNFFDGTPQADGSMKPLTCFQKWGIAGTGLAIGVFLSGPLIDLSGITVKGDRVEIGLALVLAMFGMSIAAQIIKAIREIQIVDYIKSWLPKRG